MACAGLEFCGRHSQLSNTLNSRDTSASTRFRRTLVRGSTKPSTSRRVISRIFRRPSVGTMYWRACWR